MNSHNWVLISKMKTNISEEDFQNGSKRNFSGIHESTLRAYNILENVKELLRINTPHEVILQLINLMEKNV